jgi:hypothetical protein
MRDGHVRAMALGERTIVSECSYGGREALAKRNLGGVPLGT